MSWPPEQTLQERLRQVADHRASPLCHEAAARLDELERQLAKAQYWRDRHCRESEQHAQRSGENWKAWKAAERQLATAAQAERERCAVECENYAFNVTSFRYDVQKSKESAGIECAKKIRSLAPHAKQEQDPGESAITLPDLTTRMYSHAAKEPEAAQAVANESESATERRTPTITTEPAPASGPDGEDCSDEPDKQFIEAIMVEKSELNRLRTVAEAAKAFIHSEGRENIVAAELALVNAIEQSYS
jgi:hypothetical protein